MQIQMPSGIGAVIAVVVLILAVVFMAIEQMDLKIGILNDKPQAPAKDMDPDLEAKRSGPPPTGDTTPKPLADPEPTASTEQFDRSGSPSEDIHTIEQKLQDPTFDPEGHERLRLAQDSQRHGSGRPYPSTTNVDERGAPMEPGERNPERQA